MNVIACSKDPGGFNNLLPVLTRTLPGDRFSPVPVGERQSGGASARGERMCYESNESRRVDQSSGHGA